MKARQLLGILGRCRLGRWAFLALCAVSFAKISRDLIGMVLFERRDMLNGDALIYLTMGRGLLNGLRPYVDLFESKPPGIFYLSALSLLFTDGYGLLRAFEIVSLLSLPITCLAFAWWFRSANWSAVFMAFVFGSLLAMRSQENSGGLQSEMFGIVPTLLFVVSVVGFVDRISWPWTLFRGVILASAAMIREPYAIGILAAVLLVARDWGDVWRLFVKPIVVAALMGFVLFLAGGFLGSYVQVYLPGMIERRVAVGTGGDTGHPLVFRFLWVHRFFASLTSFSTMPLLGYVTAFLWLHGVVFRQWMGKTERLIAFVMTVGGIALIHQYFVLIVLLAKTASLGMTMVQTLTDETFRLISLAYLVGSLLYAVVAVVLTLERPRLFGNVVRGLLSVLLLNIVISIGGYYWNYMLYAIPATLASLFLFVRHQGRWTAPLSVIVTVVLAIQALAYRQDDAFKYSQSPGLVALARARSTALDAVLDSCGYERFGFAGLFADFPFSKHSPVGPMFIPYFHAYLGYDHPLYAQTFSAIERDAQVFVEGRDPPKNYNDPFPESVRQLFNGPPPPCAEHLPFPSGYVLRFRSSSKSPPPKAGGDA